MKVGGGRCEGGSRVSICYDYRVLDSEGGG